jgi:hypothetical protein
MFYGPPHAARPTRFSGVQGARSVAVLKLAGEKVLFIGLKTSLLTSSVTGPDDGVAAPRLFGGYPLLHLLSLNVVARPGARGVRLLRKEEQE